MTRLVAKLKERVQLQLPEQDPNTEGGFDRGYTTIKTIWAGLKPVTTVAGKSAYIRGVQVNENTTHVLTIRRNSVSDLGKQFSSAFSIAFNIIPDLGTPKAEWFVFVQRGSTTKGRRFRIENVIDNNERREFLNVSLEEIEEESTGWP